MTNETQTSPKVFAHESIAASEQVALPEQRITLQAEAFPWLKQDAELSTALVTMADATCPQFRFASAIGTNDKLIQAANGMSEGQKRNTDNMFWSRIGVFVRDGHSSAVEAMPDSSTDCTIYVLRNNGGQRVYFAATTAKDGTTEIVRLAVCDKNKQKQVMSQLSGANSNTQHRKASK